jgi:GNAT superfamily N-acetyltransferase
VTEVRKATYADVVDLSGSLARAFDDDPVMNWLYPTASRKQKFMAFALRSLHLCHDEVYTSAGLEGGALWDPPGCWKIDMRTMLRTAPAMTWITGRNIRRGLRLVNAIERRHPKEPHYYLAILGTDPQHQGKGVGSAIMAPVLERCDAEGVGAYLESSKESNVPFYRRHGFEVTEEITIPDGGPRLWLMWRDPQTR